MPARGTTASIQDTVWAIDPLKDDRWPELIARQPHASVFHRCGWLEALRATHDYEPVAFTTSAPTERLTNASLFCLVRSWLTGSRLVSLPFSDHCELLNSLSGLDSDFSPATTYQLPRLDLRLSLHVVLAGDQ